MTEGEKDLTIEGIEIINKGRKIYLNLREEGQNLTDPRSAEDSLDPDAPRTLMDLLGESSHRARNLIATLAEEKSQSAERELEFIKLSWEGIETAAKESGDEEVARFVRSVFINSIFGGKSKETPPEA